MASRVRVVGKRVVRQVGVATQRWRPLPDYLVIGAKRGGTTSMCRYLQSHPQVLPLFPSARRLPMREDAKGVHYFDSNHHRGDHWYRSHFPTSLTRSTVGRRLGRRIVCGEGSPYYLFHPKAAERAQQLVPDARLVVMLRNPIDRAYSHWQEQRRRDNEPLDFDAAIQAEPARLADAEERLTRGSEPVDAEHEHHGYLRQSEYADGLARWMAAYPRDQLLVLWSDSFYRDPQQAFDQVCRFLDIDPHPLPTTRAWNASERGTGPSARTRARLRDHFRAADRQLGDLLGEDPPWADASSGADRAILGQR